MSHEESSSSEQFEILSTGVLNTAVGQAAARIELVNLSTTTQTIRFQIINWNTGSPVATTLTVTILPNTLETRNIPVVPFHYELRVEHPGDPDLFINHFAVDAGSFTVPGLTFLQKDLIEIKSPLIEVI